MRARRLALIAAGLVLLYFTVGAALCRYGLDHLLIPRTATSAPVGGEPVELGSELGVNLTLHRFGQGQLGCVLFFPGRHGNQPRYEQSLIPAFLKEGIVVFLVSYPGQDGTTGRVGIDEIQLLAVSARQFVEQQCTPERTVLVGRSLGSMIAAYASANSSIAGLLLESASPSLSSSLRHGLAARWWTQPLGLLPIERLLREDYSLRHAFPQESSFPISVIQGAGDTETPLSELLPRDALPAGTTLMTVEAGTHSNTYLIAPEAHVRAVLAMLKRRT